MLDRPNPPCYNSIVVQAEQQLKKMLNYVSIADFSKKSTIIWGYSSAGRALEWHSRGQRFDPAYLHQRVRKKACFREKTSLFLFSQLYYLMFGVQKLLYCSII